MGDYEATREVLAEAAAISREIGQRRTLWQILAVQAEVELGQGNGDEASALRGRAREIVDYIAGHISSEVLRASFLMQSKVQGVMGGWDLPVT
jgi:hypothetical protein